MRLITVTLLLSVANGFQTFGQKNGIDTVRLYANDILQMIKAESVYKDSINWTDIEEWYLEEINKINSIDSLLTCITDLFGKVGDKHAFLMYKGKRYRNEALQTLKLSDYYKEKRKGGTIDIVTKRIGEVGYILVPSITTANADDFNIWRDKLANSICSLGHVKGWIIDLRLNLGGNMWPMIGGLSVLLENGKLGAFVDARGFEYVSWALKNSGLYLGKNKFCSRPKDCGQKKAKVAVILGQMTTSSGEATAITFKGRKNTIFIGENTSGYVTANKSTQLSDNAILFFSSSFESDRNGNIYVKCVTPDILITDSDNFVELEKDRKVIEAKRWILGM
jgi:carboxyl-terminal processing protease